MSLINVSNLTFCYESSYENIFENVSFGIDTDWKLGFTGRNGRGKTTFLNLLLKKYEYSGTIASSVDFEYFPYDVPDSSMMTLDILSSICPAEDWEIIRELSLLAVDADALYRPFNTLSNGERTKALLAALFLKESSFLLIDEPTNHLDMKARQTVADYLNSKSGFILVSHDRAFMDSCVDHILSINKTNIEIVSGNFSSWYYNKELQDRFEIEKNDRLKKDIKRLTATAREKADWSDRVEATKIGFGPCDRGAIGHKAAKMMKRSKAIEKRRNDQIAEKEKLLKNIEESYPLKLHPLRFHSSRLIECKNLSIRYGDRQITDNISFTIEQGDRIALFGKNGSGKSSIIKLICGEEIAFDGEFKRASGLKISYIRQDASNLVGTLGDYEEEHKLDVPLFRAILRKLDFSRSQFEKNMENYSEGQKKKVLIAHSLSEKAHLYIWDEPLNFIDVISRMQIEELLLEYRPTILFVEHDRAFCENIATKIVEL